MNTRNLSKAEQAVSPVVATLLLVLVAAGAAIGFGVFLNGFQEKTQDNVKTDAAEQTLRIGGSSTVFEFSKAALDGDQTIGLPGFEGFTAAQGVPMQVELERGGSGAGRVAVGTCLTDIGSSSSKMPAAELAKYPDCNPKDGTQDFGQKMREFEIAYDGVAIVGKGSTLPHSCTAGMSLSKAQVAELYRVNGRSGATDKAINEAVPSATAVDLFGNVVDTAGKLDAKYTWADLGGTCTGTQVIKIHDRSDPGGTEEGFCSLVYAPGKTNVLAFALNDAGIGEAVCTNSLIDPTHDAIDGGDGNQGIASEMGADSLSFIGFGHIQTAGGLTAFRLDGITVSGTTIKNEAKGTGTAGVDRYPATRTLFYYTAGEPSVLEQAWMDFVLNPHYNQLIAQKSGYVSFY